MLETCRRPGSRQNLIAAIPKTAIWLLSFLICFFLGSNEFIFAQSNPSNSQAQTSKTKAEFLSQKIENEKFAKPDSAKVWANEMLVIGEAISDKTIQSNAFSYLAWVNRVWGNNMEALENAEKALEMAELANDLLLQANALYEIGIIQHELDHFTESKRSLQEAQAKFEVLQDPLGIGRTINSIGEIHRLQGEYSLALAAYRESRIHFKEANSTKGLIMVENNLGLVFAAKGDCQMALDTLKAARDKAIAAEFIGVVLESMNEIANCQLVLGQIDSAFKNAEYVLNNAQSKGFLKFAKSAAKTLCDISIVRGDYESAFKYQEMNYEFSRELVNEATQNRIASLNYDLELRQKEAEIEVLNRDRKIDSLTVTMTAAGFGVLLFLGIILVFFYHRKRKDNQLLAKQNEALSELNREKDSLINIVAHDLKSPLSKTKGLLSLLPTMSPFNEQQKKVADMINRTLDEGDRLIRDLLDISQAEGAKSSFVSVEFELNKLLKETIGSHAENAAKKQIQLKFVAHLENIPMFTDDSFLNRIFDNLLSNAIKYSDPSTEILIETGEKGDQAYFSVKDHGPGFSDEDKAKMFRKFQRLSARPTGGESSNGLGLAIIQLLANQLKASIELETSLGKGSRFKITLPKRIS